MRRSVRNLLGIAAVTTAIAVGVPAFSSAASATTASSADWSFDGHWGTYWSGNHLAKARGTIDVDYDHRRSNRVHITGRLWDLDHRTYRAGGKCALIQFRFQKWDDGRWLPELKSYRYCGAGGSKRFDFRRYDVARVQTRVCQTGWHSRWLSSCGSWRTLYNAYDVHYGYGA